MKRISAVLLSLVLLLSCAPAALTAGPKPSPSPTPEPEPEPVIINSPESFIDFARNCQRDVYSRGITFILTKDIDLTGTDFAPIPYFAGTFRGNGHTVLGLSVVSDGSRTGLFRTVAEEGTILGLNVKGTVAPGGTAQYVGGIAGINLGRIRDCSFEGTVTALECAGGVAGSNGETGEIAACTFKGDLTAEHQAGGIAGENRGALTGCTNAGHINNVLITPRQEPGFDISAFSQEDFTDLANIGGVAGENLGVISGCTNAGPVGWKGTGYNVGGIAGKSSGYITGCENSGAVTGRRDAGGIVGQLIPYTDWDFSNGRLDDLSKELGSLKYLINRSHSSAGDLDSKLSETISGIKSSTSSAISELDSILDKYSENQNRLVDRIQVDPETGEISLRDIDLSGISTAGLSAALSDLHGRAAALNELLGSTVSGLTGDLSGITGQLSRVMDGMFSALSSAADPTLFTSVDLSADETYDHDLGAVDTCCSRGAVSAENNAGGVVGSIGFEVSFDMENRLNAGDFLSSEAQESLFAAVRKCSAYGEISARESRSGGIVGSMDMGAVDSCTAAGSVRVLSGDYAGGVVGCGSGTVRGCWARTLLSGEKYVGGAAGQGDALIDCRTWTHIDAASEYAGAVAGWAAGQVSGNLYAGDAPAGVDGVSLTGQSDPVDPRALLILDDAPESFGDLTVTFLVADEVVEERTVPFGGSAGELPEVANDGDRYWKWDEFDAGAVYYSLTVTGRYYAPGTTLSSPEDPPQFLVEGVFYEGQSLTAVPWTAPETQGEVLSACTLLVNDYDRPLTVRLRVSQPGEIYLSGPGGTLERVSSRQDGQYLVFSMPNGGSFVCVRTASRTDLSPWIWGGGAAGALAVLVLALSRRKKRKAETAPEQV